MKHSHELCLIGLILITNIFAIEKLIVSEIIFNGNSFFTDHDLQSVIILQSPELFMRSEFNPKKLKRDKFSLEAYYKSNGFLNIVITTKYESISKNYIDIQFDIEEGNQYQLKEINLYGNKIFFDDEIKQIVHIPTNKIFNPLQIRRELKTLKRKYLLEGKVDIVIMDEVTIDENNVIARINIFEGSTYHIQSISISGLESVKEKYVLREILFKVDEIYNIDKIDESKKRIFDSGLFSTVEILNKLVDKENGLLDIEIKVREYKSSSIEAKFGFGELSAGVGNLTTTGVDAEARWVLGNIFNTTSNVEITGRIGSDISLVKRDFTITYRTPWTFSFRIPTQITYFHKEESEESEESELIRDGLTYSLFFNQRNGTRYELNSTLEIVQSEEIVQSDSLHTDETREAARWMELMYLSNKIQNPLNPVGGQYLSFISTISGTVLGGEVHYIKFEGEYRKYLQMGNNRIGAFRVFLGYINNLETENYRFQKYKFELGGQTSLRGWDSAIDDLKTSIIDMINLEYRFPIKNKFGGELFIDAGRLYETMDAFINTNIIWDYGVGAIYQTALGPIRIDIGFPYGEIAKAQLHVSLLYMF